ncbi:Bps1 protein [Thalictrum thalictroides]|uniref:Bps1 protein n=1 Tax=Thalictrum thalictroides TaxID=46969 RepID=A0A7J6W870_THATH|nr:Bps1 protein [Thalictrum thalictroides]
MSRAHEGQRPFFPLGNPFRMIFPKETHLSPHLQKLLNSFEQTLADRLKNLRPKDKNDVISLSWMTLAMKSLSEIHTDIKVLITELQLPVSDWDQKWMDVYLDNSVRLLDICIAFNSELSRLSQGQLLLQCVRHALDVSSSFPSPVQLAKSHTSLDEWMQQISTKNTKIENCSSILHGLAGSLHSPKIKDSAKGKVLMRAMYGVRVVSIFVCSAFATAFSGSSKTVMSLQVSDKLLWAKAFDDVQSDVNGEIRRLLSQGNMTILKELEAVDSSAKKLYPLTQDGSYPTEDGSLKISLLDLGNKMERFSQGLDFLSKEVESFFQIVLTGRDALLCNLRNHGSVSDPKQE